MLDCMAGSGGVLVQNFDIPALSGFDAYPTSLYAPSSDAADAFEAAEIDLNTAAGWFGSDAKVGVIHLDRPVDQQIYDEAVVPALARNALQVAAEFQTTHGTSAASEAASALLQFRAAGVTHVLSVFHAALYFILAAD